jgi:hypothetical protein
MNPSNSYNLETAFDTIGSDFCSEEEVNSPYPAAACSLLRSQSPSTFSDSFDQAVAHFELPTGFLPESQAVLQTRVSAASDQNVLLSNTEADCVALRQNPPTLSPRTEQCQIRVSEVTVPQS